MVPKIQHWWKGFVPAALAAMLLAAASAQASQANAVDFNVPAQPAPSALDELAAQAHVQLLFDYKALARYKTKGVTGSMTLSNALSQVLKGTGFGFQRVNRRTVAVTPLIARADRHAIAANAHDPRSPVAAPQQDQSTADPETSKSSPVALTEIIVTAERRRQRLVDAPVAVTALTGQSLRDNGISDTQSLSQLVPSLSFQKGNHISNSVFHIRGVGTQIFDPGLESDVDVIVDGVAMANSSAGFTDLADIKRVEVVKGPQNTLFGKNAVAGIIHVITEPVSKRFGGHMNATIAQGKEYRVNGTISGPLTQTLGFRLTSFYNDVGGNVYNVPHHMMINGYQSLGVRGKLRWAPTNALSFILTGSYRNMHGYCCIQTFTHVVNPLLAQILSAAHITPGLNNRGDDENTLISQSTGSTLVSLRATLQLSAGTLSSITAYQFFDQTFNQPADGLNTPSPLYLPFGLGSIDVNGGPRTISQFTQELRFSSIVGKRLTYQVGLYYLHHAINLHYQQRLGLSTCFPGTTPAAYGLPCGRGLYLSTGGYHSNSQDINLAAYGQATLRLMRGLSLLGGMRIQHDRTSFYGSRPNQRVVTGDIPLYGPGAGGASYRDTAATGQVGMRYEFNRNSQMYLTWSTGYKGAGFCTAITCPLVNEKPVLPETAKDWELGYKTITLEGRLQMNADAFYEKYSNLQVQATQLSSNGLGAFIPTNAGNAISKGVEFDFRSRPFASLTVGGGITYLKTNINVNGLQCPLDQRAGAPVITSGTPYNQCYLPTATASTPLLNVRNGVMQLASKWRGNLVVRYDHVIPNTPLAGFVQVSGTSQSKFNFSLNQDPLTEQPGYTITNASIGVYALNGKYHLNVFVNNLFNRHYSTLIFGSPLLTSATVTPTNAMAIIPKGANRYFGINVGASF